MLSSPVCRRKSLTVSTAPPPLAALLPPPLPAAAPEAAVGASGSAPLAARLNTCGSRRGMWHGAVVRACHSSHAERPSHAANAAAACQAKPATRALQAPHPFPCTHLSAAHERLNVAAVGGRQARLEALEVGRQLAVGGGGRRLGQLRGVAAVDGIHCGRGLAGKQGSNRVTFTFSSSCCRRTAPSLQARRTATDRTSAVVPATRPQSTQVVPSACPL